MPQSVRPKGRICRVTAVAAVLALVLAGCTSSEQAGSGADAGAVVLGAAAAPAGKYVSPNGNNSNSGASPDQAFKTVAYAVKQLNPGDTLFIMEGEYFENERPDSAVVVNKSGTPNAWITITAQPGATPILRSNQSNGIKVEGANYVVISNLELIGNPNGGTSSYSGSGINVDAIYGPAKNHHVKVLNNKISGFGAGGIPITGSSHVEIRGNVIHNLAEVEWTQHSGISILESFNMGFGNDGNGYSNYITGNVVYQVENKVRDNHGRFTDGNCIIMDRTNINNYSGRTLIANNLCLDNGGRGIQIFESKHVDVVNNTVYKNLKTGEIASSGGELGAFYSSDVEFANNLVWARNGLKPARTFDSSNIRFTKNMYLSDTAPEYNGASNSGDMRVSPSTAVAKNPSTNPNPANFALVNGSPAINAGTNKFNGVNPTDYSGANRVAGGTVDLGAFESSSSAPAPTTTPTTAAPTTQKPTTTKAPTTKAPTTKAPTTQKSTTTNQPTTTRKPTTKPPTTQRSTTTELPSGSTIVVTSTTAKPASGDSRSATTSADRSAPTSVPRPPSSPVSAAQGSSSTSVPSDTDRAVSSATGNRPTTSTTGAAAVDPSPSTERSSGTFRSPGAQPSGSVSSTVPPSAFDGVRSPADGAVDTVPTTARQSEEFPEETEVPEVLAFDGDPISQPPIPLEIPASAALALGLLFSYYRPRWIDRQLG